MSSREDPKMASVEPVSRTRPNLRTRRCLVVVAGVVAVIVGVVAWRVRVTRRQGRAVAAARAKVQGLGGHFVVSLVNQTTCIDLSDCRFDDSDLQTLAQHLAEFPGPGLYRTHDLNLILNGTDVTDAGLGHLRGLNVSRLDVAGTAVGNASVETIGGFELWFLDVRGSQVTDEGVARLRESLPDSCRISR